MRTSVAAVFLALLVGLAYLNILGNQFTNWDDEHLILRNKVVQALDVRFLIGQFHISYPPLPVITHALDHRVWGFNPLGFHLTDITLYTLAVIVFFSLCGHIIGDRRAALVAAALFAVHPLHVESVAWLSSRKDGLGMLFYMLGFFAYIRSEEGSRQRRIWLSALFYFCALWSKPFTVTLPVALILYDLLLAAPRPAARRIFTSKLPYLVPIAVTALAAIFLDPHNETAMPYHGGSRYATFLAVMVVVGDYCRMLVLPLRLSALYVVAIPKTIASLRPMTGILALLLLLVAAALGRRRRPVASFCIAWGLISLLPVLQIIPNNVIKADRYLFLPSAALCLFAGSILKRGLCGRRRQLVLAACVSAMTALLILTIARNRVWRDSVSLWGSVIAANPSNFDAYNNLGIAYCTQMRYDDALASLARALELKPGLSSAHNNLGNVYRLMGRPDEALAEFEKAKGLASDIVYGANVFIGMGLIYEERGEYARALEAYDEASRRNPGYLDDSALRAHREHCRMLLRK